MMTAGKYNGPGFTVGVKDRDGWRYSVCREWWDGATRPSTSTARPFASDVEAATAGIERAELLRRRSAMDGGRPRSRSRASRGGAKVARARKNSFAIACGCLSRLCDYPDLAAALEQGSIKIFDAFQEMRRRRNTEEAAQLNYDRGAFEFLYADD